MRLGPFRKRTFSERKPDWGVVSDTPAESVSKPVPQSTFRNSMPLTGNGTVGQIAVMMGVGQSTVYRYLNEADGKR